MAHYFTFLNYASPVISMVDSASLICLRGHHFIMMLYNHGHDTTAIKSIYMWALLFFMFKFHIILILRITLCCMLKVL